MSTNVVRKTVKYTIPDAPPVDSLVNRSWYKTVIDIMLTNLNELDSLATHESNMKKKKTDNNIAPTKQLNGITDTATKNELETARTNILKSNTPLYASDVNKIATNLNKIYKRSKDVSGTASTVAKDEIVGTSKLSTFISACIEISEALDPKANAVWGNDGTCNVGCEKSCQTKCQTTCQVGCQVSCQSKCELKCQTTCQLKCQTTCQLKCQTTCQVSCQNCYGGTCHDQTCGSW